MPALACRDRATTPGRPAELPAERWEEITLESAGFNSRYLLLGLEGQDPGLTPGAVLAVADRLARARASAGLLVRAERGLPGRDPARAPGCGGAGAVGRDGKRGLDEDRGRDRRGGRRVPRRLRRARGDPGHRACARATSATTIRPRASRRHCPRRRLERVSKPATLGQRPLVGSDRRCGRRGWRVARRRADRSDRRGAFCVGLARLPISAGSSAARSTAGAGSRSIGWASRAGLAAMRCPAGCDSRTAGASTASTRTCRCRASPITSSRALPARRRRRRAPAVPRRRGRAAGDRPGDGLHRRSPPRLDGDPGRGGRATSLKTHRESTVPEEYHLEITGRHALVWRPVAGNMLRTSEGTDRFCERASAVLASLSKTP